MNIISISVSGDRGVGKSFLITLIRKYLQTFGIEVEIKTQFKYQSEVYNEYEKKINNLKPDKFKVCIEEKI